jgi:hypothetical protein
MKLCHKRLLVQFSTERQYSEDSYFRERVFIQTNSHGTFLWILKPGSTTLASQELLRTSPKSQLVPRPRFASRSPFLVLGDHNPLHQILLTMPIVASPFGSIEYRETVLRRLLFQRIGFLFKQIHTALSYGS